MAISGRIEKYLVYSWRLLRLMPLGSGLCGGCIFLP
jgi:hypothetical protein